MIPKVKKCCIEFIHYRNQYFALGIYANRFQEIIFEAKHCPTCGAKLPAKHKRKAKK